MSLTAGSEGEFIGSPLDRGVNDRGSAGAGAVGWGGETRAGLRRTLERSLPLTCFESGSAKPAIGGLDRFTR